MLVLALALALAGMAAGACARQLETPSAQAPGAPMAAASRPPPSAVADAGVVDPLDEKLRHCPLTVAGVVAVIQDTEAGVEVELKASNDESMNELRKRVHHLEEFTRKKGTGTGERHNTGQGGGFMRDCPLVTRDTVVVGEEHGLAIRVAVRPNDPRDVAALRTETHRRMTALLERQRDASTAQ